jgi:3-isopropylmalate dehydrogenase
MILSTAMMLRHSFKMEEEAEAIENAVKHVLDSGKRTADLTRKGETPLSTSKLVEEIKAALADDHTIFNIMEAYA